MRSLTIILIALLLVLSANRLHSQTILTVQEDTIRSNTNWDADIVKVNGDITVAYNAHLTITPGTYVEFQGHYGLFIYGYLAAVGTDQDSITFTINDNTGFSNTSIPDGGWEGINFMETGSHDDTSKIINCNISYIKKYPNSGSYETKGGIYILSTHKVIISNSILENNYSRNSGPAIYNEADLVSFTEISNCIIRNNESRYGSGAISSYSQGKAVIKNNIIHDNDVDDAGGISVRNNALIMNNIIINNYSDGSGGGIGCNADYGDVTIINNVICNNWATSSGAGISVSGPAKIISNTICNNELKEDWEQGGGIYIEGDPLIVNNIIWGNEDNQVGFYPADPWEINAIFRHNLIQYGTASFNPDYVQEDRNNFSDNPYFVNPSSDYGILPGALDADWSVQPWSVCINNGTQWEMPQLPEYDTYGNPRVQNGQVEIGAVETHIRKIEICGDLPSDTILTADTIIVMCDIFIPDTVDVTIPPGANVIFNGHYKIDVKGRLYARGTEKLPILFTVADTSGFGSLKIDSGAWKGIRLETIQSMFSYCTFRYSKSDESGGAVQFMYGSGFGLFDHCLFEYNSGYSGGALDAYGTNTLIIDHCIFRHNHTWDQYGRGGAITINHTNLTIANSSILHNSSNWSGAFGVVSSDAHIQNCMIAHNEPNGLFYESAIPKITNCIIFNNAGSGINMPEGGQGGFILSNLIANNDQGILADGFTDVLILNNTIVNNTLSGIKGDNSKTTLANNIIYGNGVTSVDITSSIYKIYNCLIQGGVDQQYFNNGNIEVYENVLNEDPYFTHPITSIGPQLDSLTADWSINALSPCFDAGTDQDLGGLQGFPDVAGNNRIHNGLIDIGAYEHIGSIPVFIRQPKGGNLCEESKFVLSVVASDTVQYQWVKDGENVPGANAARLVLDALDFWDQGEYRCLIGNNYGQTLSNPAYVFIIELPEFLSESQDIWIAKDEPVILNTLIKGTNPNLVWEKDGNPLNGKTSTMLYIENPDSSNEGTYRCIVSNLCGADTTGEADVYIVPQICMVTVDPSTGNNLVIWEKASKAPIEFYNVYRESQAAGIYDLLGTVAKEDLSVYVDPTADPTVQAYLYKITAVDTSGFETDIDLCKPHKTIHLVVSTNPELNTTQLQWDRYYGFEYSTYNILRSATGTGFLPVHYLASSLASWTDPDPLPKTGFYRVSVDKPVPCYPAGSGKKADAGPYSHSLSNVEDNRLQAGESPPDTILLSNDNINSGNLMGALVGRFLAIDADTLDTHTFLLIRGEGDDDNMSFTILGDLLLAAEIFDHEVQDEYSIRVRCKDEGNLTREQVFTIHVWGPSGTANVTTGQLTIYPNPFTHSTNIQFPNPDKKAYRMYITDLAGKVVRFEDNIFTDKLEINREKLPAGVFFVELRGEEIFRGKLVVE